MIAPAGATITLGLVVDQPLQRRFRSVVPSRVTRGFMKTQESSSQKTHPLRRTAPGNSQQGTEVQREPAYPLLESCSQELAFEGEGAQELCVQAIERVVAPVIVFLQPIA